jgi:Lsr2
VPHIPPGPPSASNSTVGRCGSFSIMAQRILVLLQDDLDGSRAAENVKFGFDGKSYGMDLTTKNAERLRKALRPT